MEIDEETKWNYESIARAIENSGYESVIPVEEYLSSDLTEALISLNFWIREGIIRKKDGKCLLP